ncbi:S66 peptidase family protein [Brevibacillus fulvus]|uniref:Muramoyltetrapeptide carboxypeptidase n=1 Tax=Brevibacillus fulvus TaxID=1125967 RepID=A0A938XXC6_9BACL|nr:LD-carboxypeptidase [Brevibacillus fulvus]MBM7589378.1 muramoyltetrapeptide carboxypeptidase [Brevibacillus fulvus]
MVTRPPILRPGDTIGIVTLGSPLDAATINQRLETLVGMGFQVVLGEYVYAQTGMVAGTDQQRASDLMNMFENPDVKMILPTRGGVGVAGIIPHLDFRVIRRNPKIVTGYSDITVLLNVLYQYGNLITLQSLMLIDFQQATPVYNFEQFFSAVTTTTAPRVIENPPGMAQISRVPGNVIGPIVGGNLTSFVDTLGTPFEIDTRGKILLIEETHEPTNSVYRMLNQLRLAGKFADCLGIIMGECTNCPISYNTSYEDLINGFMVPLGKPLMTNVATAHGYYKAAIPIGAVAQLDTINNRLTVLDPIVSNRLPPA